MTVLYKLTRADGTTGTGDCRLQWGPGVTHSATGEGVALCSAGVIHAYAHPLLAALFSPIHVDFADPRLWKCEGDKVADDGTKTGNKVLSTIEEIPLPQISTAARVHWAILCAMQVYDDDDWRQWARDWLTGKDRSETAAVWAARAARAAAEAPVWAARAAAEAAAAAAVAVAVAWAARAARTAGAAGAAAVEAGATQMGRRLDLVALAEQAMEAEQ